MSNRTWVCVDCGKSHRRDQTVGAVACSICGQGCECVHWKLHIPSPAKAKEWQLFWSTYRREKRLVEEFQRDPSVKRLVLPLLDQNWTRP